MKLIAVFTGILILLIQCLSIAQKKQSEIYTITKINGGAILKRTGSILKIGDKVYPEDEVKLLTDQSKIFLQGNVRSDYKELKIYNYIITSINSSVFLMKSRKELKKGDKIYSGDILIFKDSTGFIQAINNIGNIIKIIPDKKENTRAGEFFGTVDSWIKIDRIKLTTAENEYNKLRNEKGNNLKLNKNSTGGIKR